MVSAILGSSYHAVSVHFSDKTVLVSYLRLYKLALLISGLAGNQELKSTEPIVIPTAKTLGPNDV